MSSTEPLRVGTAYVNERVGLLREFVEEMDRFRIRFNEFDLKTGRLRIPVRRIGYKRPFARWAKRQATSAERAQTHPTARGPELASANSDELGRLEHEHRRAGIEQVVHSNVMHRW